MEATPARTNDKTTAAARILRCDSAGQYENARADDGPDAERRQVGRSEHAFQPSVGECVNLELRHTFSSK